MTDSTTGNVSVIECKLNCGRPARAKGLCQGCYNAQQRERQGRQSPTLEMRRLRLLNDQLRRDAINSFNEAREWEQRFHALEETYAMNIASIDAKVTVLYERLVDR